METELFSLFKKYHDDSLKEFKNELIESIKNLLNLNQKNNKGHICGYTRTRNRGTCKRLCIGEVCVYHKKYKDNIKNVKNNKEKHIIPDKICNINGIVDDIVIQEEKNDNNIKSQIISNLPDKTDDDLECEIVPSRSKNKKLKKKRYLVEYKLLCYFVNKIIQYNLYKNIYIPDHFLENIKNKINYEKNKLYGKDEIKKIIKSIEDECKKIEENSPELCIPIILYCSSLIICFLKENYHDEQFIEIKKQLKLL